MTETRSAYPKDHSWKRWKVVGHYITSNPTVDYCRTYAMARIVAFLRFIESGFASGFDIVDQRLGGGHA